MAAFLASPAASRRRRAFLAALEPRFGREAALQAIDLWENAFGSDQPLLRGISQFAEMLVQEFDWRISSADLSVLLLRHLQKPTDGLPPDPLDTLTGQGAAQAFPATRPSAFVPSRPTARPPMAQHPAPEAATLGVLLVKLCDAAGQADPSIQAALLRRFFEQCAGSVSPAAAADANGLLTGRSESLGSNYDRRTAVAIVGAFYVALAELYGPVSADRIVTASVLATDNTSEGRSWSARNLL